jgi:uncharacterized protein (TIGR03118 family)
MTITALARKAVGLTALSLGLAMVCAPRAEAAYIQTNLISDISGLATITDSALKNPWGVSESATGPFWISDQGTSLSTLYSVSGAGVSKAALTVAIPTTGGGPQGPTGQVFNPTAGFVVGGTKANFLFANLNGTISAWNTGTLAQIAITTPGAIYTGLTIDAGTTRLYAANSAQNRIDVFNGSFAPVSLSGGFSDPSLPAGFVPFNIQNIGGKIYVTYSPAGRAAQISATPGMGVVDVFDLDGNLLQRLITGSQLASPWGITLAPLDFGAFGGDLLVGNFSFLASEINAFDPTTGAFLGTIPIDVGPNTPGGLWNLSFGNGGTGGFANTLYFTDGINGEANGLFAAISATAVPEPSSLLLLSPALLLIAADIARNRRRRATP